MLSMDEDIELYHGRYTGPQIDDLLDKLANGEVGNCNCQGGSGGSSGSGSSTSDPITMRQFNEIEKKENRLYFIVDSNGILIRIYYNRFIIARKADSGEMVFSQFPMRIPMLFA